MSLKVILTCEPGSAKFHDRVLILDGEDVRVGRSSGDERSGTDNAVFDCRVRYERLLL